MQVQHLGFEEVEKFHVMIVLSVKMFAVWFFSSTQKVRANWTDILNYSFKIHVIKQWEVLRIDLDFCYLQNNVYTLLYCYLRSSRASILIRCFYFSSLMLSNVFKFLFRVYSIHKLRLFSVLIYSHDGSQQYIKTLIRLSKV